MVEGPIDQNQTWRTVLLAFAIWAAHFLVVYAASLIFPGQIAALWIALATSIAALAALAWLWWRARALTTLDMLAIGLAALFVVYDTLPALFG